ncbi:MAG: PKD domain-containing protein, partial [Saprospiraceae bacterium]|nr:PKD domain-containing protein [Bacteroidia bacterium]NNL91934.1 PKD domain-containing protein [Saprospiraceae bacterium]
VQSNNIIWSITPPTAGNFLVNSGNTAEIIFFEPGNHRLTASFCGFIRDFDVEVEDPPSFTYNAPIGICSGETDRIIISGDLDLSIIVKDEDMNVVSTSRDFQIGPGIYTIEAISPIGCSEIAVVSIDNYDLPDIRISTPDEKGFCQFISPVTFYGLNANDGYTFEWFKDGVALGRSDEIINVTEFGTYTLEVTNINGCKKTSNAIRLFQNCTVGGWCDGRCESLNLCESPDSIKFEATQLGFCNTYSFRNTSSPGVDVNSLFYDFDDPQSGINNRTYLPDADHVFSHAGYYTVMLLGFVPSLADPSLYCDDYEVVQIEVPVAANFEFQKSCANTEYNFLDKSTFVNNNTITNYEWDFGDPSSGSDNTSNDRNATHTYSQSGKYFVSLTITSGTGCIARIIKEVEVLQTPVFDLNLPFEQCINESIKFEALDTGNLIKFLWEFDDPTGGNSNSVASSTTLHKFGTPGIYNVSLTCENNLGCKSTVVKAFQVGINSLTGDISIDKTLPVCEGDSVTMTAPNGGVAYLWSNGHIGQSIKVADPAEYSVTVINSDACDYVPQSVYLTVLPKPDISITGYTYEDNSFIGEPHYKTLEICQYEYFTLSTQYIVGATYSWSTGGNQFYNSGIQPNNLIPGDHTVTVDVTTNNGCTFTSDPFIITVHPLPDNFTISSNNAPLCEGETYTLSVDAPNPSYEYIWSTGQLGEQIEVIAPGRYYVQAINEFGCDRFSNTLTLHAKPDVSYFQTGCLETCFPDEICFPLNLGGSIITWVKDGEVVSGQNSNTLTVDEAGEYQVIIASFAGCIDTSAILTLEAKPNDQSVSGTVFIDENDNEIFDGLDEAINNITVNLMTGSTILETSMTDVTGQYVFDPVTSLNTYILIDTTGTGLNVPDSELRLDLIFDQCIEEKILDFPLSKNCEPIIENITLETCS